MDLKQIVEQFDISGTFISAESFGMGHINDTYAVTVQENEKQIRYVLQKLNQQIFQNIEGLMANVISVSKFLREKILKEGGDPARECLNFVETKTKKGYLLDETGAWRMYRLVEDAEAYQIIEDPAVFEEAGCIFGKFVRRLADFPAQTLCEVIPAFHDTGVRMRQFEAALEKEFEGRSKEAAKEIEFVLERRAYCARVTDLLASGALPLRVTHNDTKLNNALIDTHTKKAVCVIDLDTIMPGSLLYDFGDAIRSGCSTALEDEPDLAKVSFDINLFEYFVRGYLKELRGQISESEKKLLAFGAILMTYECGMRFLTDHLSGDTYFKVKYPGHNLVRARTQFKLVHEMEQKLDLMNKIVEKYGL